MTPLAAGAACYAGLQVASEAVADSAFAVPNAQRVPGSQRRVGSTAYDQQQLAQAA
eukprot:CAMPEP_0115441386 /NCGR_PEP_ID=MMETSP0271-20121206/36800_1 /TAXON_ID=71861 /ORGANISM="Scrippsiella trochoidea, Strain CCMP3099" /LENGTH=55 /DNA_ID=CAMNT_0002867177 /DNA_START=8 /DNA_END=172 /DNA_ORIENTATION=-